MNSASPVALLTELADCHALLQRVAARLWAVASAMEAAGENGEANTFPNQQAAGKAGQQDFPKYEWLGK